MAHHDAAKPTVVFIVGATASGKTAAALDLATRTQAEVVNADSRQVYRGMSIGTAKPTPGELAAVPHHLIDVAGPTDGYSLAAFLAQARDAIERVLRSGRHPIVVGGSGQYVWGLAEGWRAPEVPPQHKLRAELEREAAERGADALHARLAAVDAEAAAAIDARNVRRVVRAIEVWEVTGATFSSQRRKEPPPFEPRLFGIDVPRAELHARIDARVEEMMERGWLAEVRALLDAGCAPELPAFSSAGYRPLAAHLRGELSLDDAVADAKQAARRLARSQAAWFRRADQRIAWVASAEELVREALSALEPQNS
ncbi:MAG: tRNA (adenosine(37)-N6)-dimethylallyltransferase MiaA [Chloroflexi bacterium]|nr:tRNA (adenosine(37)-N6)-dimethylallyltransferase MiaA [Chloroflexota bacterium]